MDGNVLFNDALNTFYFYSYFVLDIQITKDENHCHHTMGYPFQLVASDRLYAPSHIKLWSSGWKSIPRYKPSACLFQHYLFNDILNTFLLTVLSGSETLTEMAVAQR